MENDNGLLITTIVLNIAKSDQILILFFADVWTTFYTHAIACFNGVTKAVSNIDFESPLRQFQDKHFI